MWDTSARRWLLDNSLYYLGGYILRKVPHHLPVRLPPPSQRKKKKEMAPTDSIASKISGRLNLLGLLQPDEQPSRLCTNCAGMTVKALKEGYRHLENVWDLPSSAENCDLCAMIMRRYVGSRTGSFHDDKEAFVEELQRRRIFRIRSFAVELGCPNAYGGLTVSLVGQYQWQQRTFTHLRIFSELSKVPHLKFPFLSLPSFFYTNFAILKIRHTIPTLMACLRGIGFLSDQT